VIGCSSRSYPKLVNTRNKALEERRSLIAADWLVRVHTLPCSRVAGLVKQAKSLEQLPEITSVAHVPSIRGPLEAVRRDAAAASKKLAPTRDKCSNRLSNLSRERARSREPTMRSDQMLRVARRLNWIMGGVVIALGCLVASLFISPMMRALGELIEAFEKAAVR
jgi:hypothetical protein